MTHSIVYNREAQLTLSNTIHLLGVSIRCTAFARKMVMMQGSFWFGCSTLFRRHSSTYDTWSFSRNLLFSRWLQNADRVW